MNKLRNGLTLFVTSEFLILLSRNSRRMTAIARHKVWLLHDAYVRTVKSLRRDVTAQGCASNYRNIT